jgi:signal transduction histidine kinase
MTSQEEGFQKTIAELKRLNSLNDEFINVASHELKNLVQPILLFAELAKHGDMDKDRAIDVILATANKLKQLTSDILAVNKIDSDRFVCETEKVDVNGLVEEIVGATRLRLSPEVKLETSFVGIDASEELSIDGDRMRLSQLLTNLINNSAKFTAKGSILLRLNAQPKKNQLEISISDSGSGIPAEVMARLFDKFVPKSTAQGSKQGTGLGLYISKAIVKRHNGEISASNNPTGGTTFRIVLPIRQNSQNEDEKN